MLERLIVAEDKRILSGIELDSPEWDNYFPESVFVCHRSSITC
jgi:hypothetical protein